MVTQLIWCQNIRCQITCKPTFCITSIIIWQYYKKTFFQTLESNYLRQKTPNFDQPYQVISSATVFHLGLPELRTSSSITVCSHENLTCSVNLEFRWLEKSPCETGFLCVNTDEHLCSDFGFQISLYRDGAEQTSDYCHQNSIFEMSMNENSSAKFQLWFNPTSSFKGKCYFWCLNKVRP